MLYCTHLTKTYGVWKQYYIFFDYRSVTIVQNHTDF